MVAIIEITQSSIYFRTDDENLLNALRPIKTRYNAVTYAYWIPKSQYSLETILKYADVIAIRHELEQLQQAQAQLHINAKHNPNPLLRDYQKLGAEHIKNNNHLLIWEMQTGKTATVCNALSSATTALIVVEKGHEAKWTHELEKFGNRTDVYYLGANQGAKQYRTQRFHDIIKQPHWIIITNPSIIEELSTLFVPRFEYLIIDEGHWLTNPTSKRSKACKKLKDRAKYTTIMTGTPTSHSPNQMITLLKFLHGENKFAFYLYNPYFFEEIPNRFSNYPEYGKVLDFRLREWKSFLEQYSSNVLMNEDMKPTIKRIVHQVKLHPTHAQLYDKLSNEFSYGDIQLNNIVQVIVRQQQMALTPQLLQLEFDENMEAKWCWLKWYLANHPKEQVIIFSTFTSYLELIAQRLQKLQYPLELITGKTSARTRNIAVRAFQEKRLKLLLCNTIAGGKGWTLNRADTIIFLNRDWNPINNDQAEARFNAQGEDINPNKKIIDVIAKDTFEEYVLKTINEKWDKTKVVHEYARLMQQTMKDKQDAS